MTHIISMKPQVKKIEINATKNSQIRDLHRRLVALSFTNGNHSEEYQNTLEQIHQLRNSH